MRTHDDGIGESTRDRSPGHGRFTTAEPLAQRSILDRKTDTLNPGAVAYLQRTAGNQAVDGLLNDEAEPHSPVLDVVGKGGGQPLDPGVRAEMEGTLGHDFSDVRVHTDAPASASARAVQAQAYTVGNDVVFDSGKYSPDTADGRRTLAHELTHVAQQRSGPVEGRPADGGISVSDPSDRFERAANEVADHIGAAPHEPAASGGQFLQRSIDVGSTDASGAQIQRQIEPEDEQDEEMAEP